MEIDNKFENIYYQSQTGLAKLLFIIFSLLLFVFIVSCLLFLFFHKRLSLESFLEYQIPKHDRKEYILIVSRI